MKGLIFGLLVIGAISVQADRIAFGGTYNGQGCPLSDSVEATTSGWMEYERENAKAYVRRAPRGADCTETGLTLDFHMNKDLQLKDKMFFRGQLGYTRKGVTGFDAQNTVVFGSVDQPEASINLGWGDKLKFVGGYNLANTAFRVGASYDLGHFLFRVEHSAGFSQFEGSFARNFGDSWGIKVAVRGDYGFNNLPDPFSGRADAPAANKSEVFEFGFTYEL